MFLRYKLTDHTELHYHGVQLTPEIVQKRNHTWSLYKHPEWFRKVVSWHVTTLQTCNHTGRSQNCLLNTLAPLPLKIQISYTRQHARLLD
jgi:hypothetical protein